MPLLKTSLISKVTLLLVAAMFSVSAMAADFDQVQRKANQGFVEDQAALGLMYYNGEGVRQDYAKAAEWYEKSANQGYANAQFDLGLMYGKGLGVRQNRVIAKEWIGKSCDNGFQKGCDGYRILNQR